VLFYGSLNERRKEVLEKIQSGGAKVVHAFDCYGETRDALIARSKIVLNLHYYDAKIFEIARCSYLMANSKCIVSETGKDIQLEDQFKDGICFSSYDNVPGLCLSLLADGKRREEVAKRGFEIFSRMSQAKYLEAVL